MKKKFQNKKPYWSFCCCSFLLNNLFQNGLIFTKPFVESTFSVEKFCSSCWSVVLLWVYLSCLSYTVYFTNAISYFLPFIQMLPSYFSPFWQWPFAADVWLTCKRDWEHWWTVRVPGPSLVKLFNPMAYLNLEHPSTDSNQYQMLWEKVKKKKKRS